MLHSICFRGNHLCNAMYLDFIRSLSCVTRQARPPLKPRLPGPATARPKGPPSGPQPPSSGPQPPSVGTPESHVGSILRPWHTWRKILRASTWKIDEDWWRLKIAQKHSLLKLSFQWGPARTCGFGLSWEAVTWWTMVDHGGPWWTMVDHGEPILTIRCAPCWVTSGAEGGRVGTSTPRMLCTCTCSAAPLEVGWAQTQGGPGIPWQPKSPSFAQLLLSFCSALCTSVDLRWFPVASRCQEA